jgi:glycosyltransferase involved in cell wall biosynthesis
MPEIASTKQQIIQVVSYYPPHLGGMENAVEKMAEGFADKGYSVSVYTSDRGYSRKGTTYSKPRVHYLKSIEFAHTPIIFTLFFRLLALPRHSLIHVHVAQAFSPEIVFLISKLKRIQYIAHIWLDVDASGPLGFLLEPYKKLFLKSVLKSAAKIICQTEVQKSQIACKYALPLESIAVVPNGVAEAYFVGKKTSQNPVPHLLFVGRLSAQKNVSLLIEAISHMQTSVFLDIVGEGELRENIEATIQRFNLHNVHLHGQKKERELIEFYQSADIFVLPSLKEGLSLALLEALAAGLPVVASDLPEMRQILGECGVLIQNPSATNYAKALDALISNTCKMQEMSTLAVQKARFYSWEHVLHSLEDVYKVTTEVL